MGKKIALGLAAALFLAGPAHADWLRGESERFIVYSDGSAGELRTYVQKLESYDRALRMQTGVDLDAPVTRKLPVYLTPNRETLQLVRPGLQRDIDGFYIGAEEDIFAVADRQDGGTIVLLHEYAHHFMSQNFAGGYPAWFIEGFADYYSTADIASNRVMLGRANEWRVAALAHGERLALGRLLSSSPGQVTDWGERRGYYPTAWLLTHYFMSDDARRQQLAAYLADVGQGGDPTEAMVRATGMNLDDLTRALDHHLRSRLPYFRLNGDFPRASVEIERMEPSATALLLVNQRLKTPIPEDEHAKTVAEIKARAAPFGDDPLALLAVGHAELHFGDKAEGEAVLGRLLETHPDHAEALQLMASARIAQAGEAEGADVDRLMGEAQGFLRRAYQADPTSFTTLILGLQTRWNAPGYPSDGDINTWIQAYRLAPQLDSVRIGAAQALLFRHRKDEGLALLAAVANDPHGGESAAYAQRMIADAEAGVEVSQPTAPQLDTEDGTGSAED